jgi:hypothetical protein
MPYSIDRYSSSTPVVVEDGTINSTFDIKLIGKNYAGYGEVQNENFLHILENFAGTNQPPRPVTGQIWFDSGTSKLKFYDGIKWRSNGGSEIGTTAPVGLTTGDFWFDTDNDQLWVWSDHDEFVLIGPQTAAGITGLTQMRSTAVRDDLGGLHAIIEAVVDDVTVYVMSSDEFTLGSINPIVGYSLIKKGLTLSGTNTSGVTTTDHRFWGTASNAAQSVELFVEEADEYQAATTLPTENTVAARNSSGDIYANIFQGVASSAQFADLAEKYLADQDYEAGTVVCIGGEAEVTASSWGKRAIGVVSTNPAFMMNKDLEGGTYIALKGRVPVKVIGRVKKGDELIATNDGCAMMAVPHASGVFAVALETSNDEGVKVIEALVL